MTDEDEIDSIIEDWSKRRLEDKTFDPIADLDAGRPHRERLVRRWKALVSSGFLDATQSLWTLPSEELRRDWQAASRPGEFEREYGGRYLCIKRIGRTQASDVFLAFDVELERDVAVKVLRYARADSSKMRAFLDEARKTGGVEHPSIIPLYDVGESQARELYFVMKLVPGDDLAQSIAKASKSDRPPFTPKELVRILRSIAEALSYSHARGLLHRDLKPSNVMVGQHGEVLLMDWGIARSFLVVEGARSEMDPEEVSISGTPQYMAPEQARGDKELEGPCTDVFGLGALMYHLLTGGPPYRGDFDEVLERAQEGRRSPVTRDDWRRCAPRELLAIANKAMATVPADRYASANEFIGDLDAYLENRSGSAWKDGPLVALQKSVSRHPVATVAVLLGLVVGALSFGLVQSSRREQFERDVNERAAWVDRAQTMLDQPRAGLSHPDRYDQAARRIQIALTDIGIDVLDPAAGVGRYRTLVVEDPNAADIVKGLIYDLGLALARSGNGFRHAVGESLVRLTRIEATTIKEDPTLLDLWGPYGDLRLRLADDEWSMSFWAGTTDLMRAGGLAAQVHLNMMAQEVDNRSEADARGFARLTKAAGDTTQVATLRRIRNRFPAAASVHGVLSTFAVLMTDHRSSSGLESPTRRLRSHQEAAMEAMAAWAASPNNAEVGLMLAERMHDVTESYFGAAAELEAIAKGLGPDVEDGADEAMEDLRSIARGYRLAGLSQRQQQTDLLRSLLAREPVGQNLALQGVAWLSTAHGELRSQFGIDDRARVLIEFADRGFSLESLEREFDDVLALAKAIAWDHPEAVVIAAESLTILDRFDDALDVIDEALAHSPDEPRLVELKGRIQSWAR